MNDSPKTPTILVIFGATGDLMAKKIVPALFHLFEKQKLPKLFKVVGFSFEKFTEKEFSDFVFKKLMEHEDADAKTCSDFCKFFSHQAGQFQNAGDYFDLQKLLKQIDDEWGVCSNKLFYLASPPNFYEPIFKHLASSGLTKPCGPEEGWTRVIVEKPFGSDLRTARKLDVLLEKLFKEIQIYRIDHYMAKEMVQNILAFRFSNNLFEIGWGNQLVESIHIKLLEKIGVEDRGAFYDSVGALRDVGQNHLLQMLALVTMDNPVVFNSETIRKKRGEILKTLEIPNEKEIPNSTFRAQYDGYRNIKGVAQDSTTETYFKARAFLSDPRWRGVPIFLESGKRLGNPMKEIEVIFKHPMPCLCPPGITEHYKNKLIIHWEPKEGITIRFWSKKPGLKMEIEERTFEFLFRNQAQKAQYTEEYEKLLLDCIAGDQTLFVSSEEIEATWKFIDPIISAWQKNKAPLKSYKPDTDSILKEARIVETKSYSKLLKKEFGIIGLGKMGANMAERLRERNWKVFGFDKGGGGTATVKELIERLSRPRLIWLMIPAGAVEETIFGKDGLVDALEGGDIIIDGGNSFYEDSMRRSKKLNKIGIPFLDAGVSGGPSGARNGASIMIGGDKRAYEDLEYLFQDLAVIGGYAYMGKSGAGHFVKMIHNGIEYGMMQAIAEGFAVLKKAPFKFNLREIAEVYNHGSVVESRLIGWLGKAFEEFDEDLKKISGSVGYTGEGEWTIKTAEKFKVPVQIIKESFKFRVKSHKAPNYIGKILSALRNQFGGHEINKNIS